MFDFRVKSRRCHTYIVDKVAGCERRLKVIIANVVVRYKRVTWVCTTINISYSNGSPNVLKNP